MKKMIRLISLLLAVLMLTSVFVACNGDTEGDGDNSGNAASTQGATTDKTLPDTNWGGTEYVILGREGTTYSFQNNFEVDYEELGEDVVAAAVWNRNNTLMEKYGIDIVGNFASNPANNAKTALESGDAIYDLILCSPEKMLPFATSGFLVDMNTLNYINYEHDAWNDYANEQLTMGGKLFYTTNKFLLQDKHRSWAMMYNRELARELNIGYLETMVFDGTWTIDKLIEIAKQGSADTDGVVGMTHADQWGVDLADPYCFSQLAFGCGFRLAEAGSDGYPQLVGATDRIITILDKIYELVLNQEDCFVENVHPGQISGVYEGLDMFFQGRAVIMAESISELENMSQVEYEFGILPNPKYDEDQDDYYAIPNLGNGCLLAIPATVEDLDYAGFAIEALSEESVATSYHAYIETRCKLQDAYDEDAAKCLDIIFNNVVYDTVFVNDIGGLGWYVGTGLANTTSNTYARMYDRLSKIANNELKKIKESFANIG